MSIAEAWPPTQQTATDCGPCVVAFWGGSTRAEALDALGSFREEVGGRARPDPDSDGTTYRELRRALRKGFGVWSRCVTSDSRHWPEIGTEDGAMMVLHNETGRGHWIAVLNGQAWCPLDGLWRPLAHYLVQRDYSPHALVIVDTSEPTIRESVIHVYQRLN